MCSTTKQYLFLIQRILLSNSKLLVIFQFSLEANSKCIHSVISNQLVNLQHHVRALAAKLKQAKHQKGVLFTLINLDECPLESELKSTVNEPMNYLINAGRQTNRHSKRCFFARVIVKERIDDLMNSLKNERVN